MLSWIQPEDTQHNLHPLLVALGTHSCSHTPLYLQDMLADGC